MRRSKDPFYMDNNANYSSQYIFDDAYQNAMKKIKFQKNPKFQYFNAIIKMKNKLENQQHDVYTKVFQYNDKPQYDITLMNHQFNKTARTWVQRNSIKDNIMIKQSRKKPRRNLSHVQQIQFQMLHSPRNGQMYNQRPRLDDVMAGFRKMGKTGSSFRQRSVRNSSKNKKYNQLQLLQKQANKHLPKSSSFMIPKSSARG